MRSNDYDYEEVSEFDDFDYFDTRAARRRANKSKREELVIRRKKRTQQHAKYDWRLDEFNELDAFEDDFSIDFDDYSIEDFDSAHEKPINHV